MDLKPFIEHNDEPINYFSLCQISIDNHLKFNKLKLFKNKTKNETEVFYKKVLKCLRDIIPARQIQSVAGENSSGD